MDKNNFQKLEEEMEEQFSKSSEAIKQNVTSRKGMWDLIGDLFELYIPQIFSTLIGSNTNLKNTGLKKGEDNEIEI